jgi:hypothetical protein
MPTQPPEPREVLRHRLETTLPRSGQYSVAADWPDVVWFTFTAVAAPSGAARPYDVIVDVKINAADRAAIGLGP